jgi:hypothetical protein
MVIKDPLRIDLKIIYSFFVFGHLPDPLQYGGNLSKGKSSRLKYHFDLLKKIKSIKYKNRKV